MNGDILKHARDQLLKTSRLKYVWTTSNVQIKTKRSDESRTYNIRDKEDVQNCTINNNRSLKMSNLSYPKTIFDEFLESVHNPLSERNRKAISCNRIPYHADGNMTKILHLHLCQYLKAKDTLFVRSR